jgi:alkylhydroperoxidase/carboxymuconolactone decarboxylase family protein YurZ
MNEQGPARRDLSELADAFGQPHVASQLQQVAAGAYAAAAPFWRTAHTASALSPRMTELVLVALHGTISSLNSDALRRHVARALDAGATHAEVLDVLLTIAPIGNHALYFAVPVLMRELEALQHPDAQLPPITPEAQSVKEDFMRVRGFWNDKRDAIARAMPEYFVALSTMSMQTWAQGALTEKERELVCIAIDCTVTHMFEEGLAMHIRHALAKGATRDEILAVFQLASVTGLEGFVIGAEALFPQAPEGPVTSPP